MKPALTALALIATLAATPAFAGGGTGGVDGRSSTASVVVPKTSPNGGKLSVDPGGSRSGGPVVSPNGGAPNVGTSGSSGGNGGKPTSATQQRR